MSKVYDGLQYIKAWELREGDEIMKKSPTGNTYYVKHVLEVREMTSRKQGVSTGIVVVTKGSYSPEWKVYESSTTVAIRARK